MPAESAGAPCIKEIVGALPDSECSRPEYHQGLIPAPIGTRCAAGLHDRRSTVGNDLDLADVQASGGKALPRIGRCGDHDIGIAPLRVSVCDALVLQLRRVSVVLRAELRK